MQWKVFEKLNKVRYLVINKNAQLSRKMNFNSENFRLGKLVKNSMENSEKYTVCRFLLK